MPSTIRPNIPSRVNVEIGENSAAAIDIDYWTDTMTSAQAENVTATFVQALSNIVEHADIPLSQLDHIHGSTKKARIWAWNKNVPAPTVDCVHSMVEKQVAIRPQAPAICGWDGEFSYQEMNALADHLAMQLVNLGVGAETRSRVL